MDEQSVIVKLLSGALAAIVAMGAYIWRSLHVKIDGKASNADVVHAIGKLDEHLDECREAWQENRDVHRRIFDKMDDTTKAVHELVGTVKTISERKIPWT